MHNIILSMPGRTPPEAVLAAARVFARALRVAASLCDGAAHRPRHPHVHLVVKAEHEYEPGRRLHIRKATLRQWREDFAACMRAQGVAANATPGWQRGRIPTTKKDAIHQRLKDLREYDTLPPESRARRKPPKTSTFMHSKVEAVARDLSKGRFEPGAGKVKLQATRRAVEGSWFEIAADLRAQGEVQLARDVEAFVASMPRVRTEQEAIAAGLLAQVEALRRREPHTASDTARPRDE